MKINGIVLSNFGSYEGLNQFDTTTTEDKNIILIGGKNGAGKTTLFNAVKLCLYGCFSMGHKANNASYYRSINKLVNNTAKLEKNTEMFILLNIEIENNQGFDTYILKRSWIINDSIVEKFVVDKNNSTLSDKDLNDFEKYIRSIIPPELFDFYFFDGERIADYFLNEESNARIKHAFLTLCGYDIFDLMHKNFKRIYSKDTNNDDLFDKYLKLNEELNFRKNELKNIEEECANLDNQLEKIDYEIEILDSDFEKNGGITAEDLNDLNNRIKFEEKKRQLLNQRIKAMANETIPFIMIVEQLKKLREQINLEGNNAKYFNFCEIIKSNEIKELLDDDLFNKIIKVSSDHYLNEDKSILNLSAHDSAKQVLFIDNILISAEEDISKLKKCKQDIRRSLVKSNEYRKIVESKDIRCANEYSNIKAQLIEQKNEIIAKQLKLKENVSDLILKIQGINEDFIYHKKLVENDLKKKSINDISAKAIVMLEKLQDVLYSKKVKDVENNLKSMLSVLARKHKFIDEVEIDNNFVIHLYKTELFDLERIKEIRKENNREQLEKSIGKKATQQIFESSNECEMLLSIEIDKTSLSQGEKQIFVMALFYSLIRLSKYSIPFIIDTPFARIDSEHRKNISTYFFKKLKGQLFILSTNEEINDEHLGILRDRVKMCYLLENNENKRTTIKKDKYFEVN